MSHKGQIEFCEAVKALYPSYFKDSNVIDAGSRDINGTNKYLFEECKYVGVDIIAGKNVDLISPIHKVKYPNNVDVLISTEMLEHDKDWEESLINMYKLLKKKGLMIITCASTGRKEHGTKINAPEASPTTVNYYQNLNLSAISSILKKTMYKEYYLKQKETDLYFYGIKK